VKESPLFNIRSSKAIGKESKDLTCDYVGKGEENRLYFPKRDDRAEFVQKVIDIISKMDDEKYEEFIGLVIERISKSNVAEKNIIQENLQLLYNLKYTSEDLRKYPINLKEDESNPPTMMSFADECCPTSGGFACILLWLYFIIVLLMTIPSIILEWILYYYCLFTPAITFE